MFSMEDDKKLKFHYDRSPSQVRAYDAVMEMLQVAKGPVTIPPEAMAMTGLEGLIALPRSEWPATSGRNLREPLEPED
jgi:hypothetical protein